LPQFSTQITTTYNCSLERAFKSPMLCDIKKVHSGYLFMPKVTHCANDDTWGKVGGSRLCYFAPSLFSKAGGTTLDTVLERKENAYWKIEIGNLSFPSMGIKKFQGEWTTIPNSNGTVTIIYTYTLFTESALLAPFHWLLTKLLWRVYMKHVLENVRKMAEGDEPFLHA
jgi:hypothetical protein